MSDSFLSADSWDSILRTLDRDRSERARRSETARGLLHSFLDEDDAFVELSAGAGSGIYEAELGRAADHLITGIGRIAGRHAMIVIAADQNPEAPLPPTLIRKIDRAQQIAAENRLGVLYVVGSSGRFAPTDEEQFPDQNDWGRLAATASRLRHDGIFQVTVSLGALDLTGPLAPVGVDAAVLGPGSELDPGLLLPETGVHDLREADGPGWPEAVRDLFGNAHVPPAPVFARRASDGPSHDPETIYELMPLDPSYEYDTRAIIERIVDADSFMEYKSEYGRTILCGYARVDGWSVGVIANNKQHVQPAGRPIEVGGVIYPESADKGARFVMDCNQNRLPLLFLQDVNGFMVGRAVELAGIIRSGAKLVNAVANSVVPKITVILGGSYGAGNYALCGRGYSPRFLYAWPTCRYAVMGGAQAARTLLSLRVRQLAREGQEPDEETLQELGSRIQERYDDQLDPRYAEARLWVDAVIAPHETRRALSRALEIAALNDRLEPFKTGVLQV